MRRTGLWVLALVVRIRVTLILTSYICPTPCKSTPYGIRVDQGALAAESL